MREIIKKLNFRFRRPDCKVLVVKGRHSGVIQSSLIGLPTFAADLTVPTIFLSVSFLRDCLSYLKSNSRDVAYLLALIQHLQPAVVISTDALVTMNRRSMLHELSERIKSSKFISVPHGSYQKGYEFHPTDSETGKELQFESEVILASIGNGDLKTYNRWGLKHKRIVPIGLLSNAIYLRDRLAAPVEKRFQICVVEHLGDPSKNHLPLQKKAMETFETLCEFVDRYALRNQIGITIALRPTSKSLFDSDGEIDWVVNWFRDKFKSEITFTDSSKNFATHMASDESELTVGVDSTALLESMGRGNKVLTIWYDESPLGIPESSWTFLKNPSFESFVAAVDRIMAADIQVYLEKTKFDREQLIECQEGSAAIRNLTQLIEECIKTN